MAKRPIIGMKKPDDVKKEEVKKVKISETAKKENDKKKEERMNRALQRVKKKREKAEKEKAEKEKVENTENIEEGQADSRNTGDVRFKSIRIKNMADLLENQMNKSPQAEEGGEHIKVENDNKEGDGDEAIDKMFEMMQRKSIVRKRKKTKKKFEE